MAIARTSYYASLLFPRIALIYLALVASLAAQVTLTVQPQQVSLVADAGSTAPTTQTVALVSTGQSLPFSATVRYLGSVTGWLSVSPLTGTPPASLTISASAAGLPAGTYSGQVAITSGSLGTVVNVFFTVRGGSTSIGSFVTDKTGLTFLGEAGVAILPAQTLQVSSTAGSVAFTAFATSSGNWLTVGPTSGTTPTTLTVVAIQSGLPAGTHTGTITIAPVGVGNPTVIPVTLLATGSGEIPKSIVLTQTSVTVRHQLGTSQPSTQRVGVVAVGGTTNFTASTTSSWIRLVSDSNPTPAATVTDFAPGDFLIQVDPTGLAAGTYVGTVDVTGFGLPPQQLPVTLVVTPSVALNADPSSILFDDNAGTFRSIIVSRTGTGEVTFNVSVAPAASWLTVAPSSATTASGSTQLVAQANPSGLATGTYNTSIVLTIAGTTTSFNIPVRYNVIGAAENIGTLQLSAESIEFTGIIGLSNPSQVIGVGTSDGIPQNFVVSASSAGGWLSVDRSNGTTPALVTIRANPAAVPEAGEYQGTVTFTSLLTGEQVNVEVTLNAALEAVVADPPSLSFNLPRTGGSPPSQTINLASNAPSSFSVSDVPRWIRVSPTQGTTPATLTVWVEAALVPPGSTETSFVVNGPKNKLTVPIAITLPEASRLTVSSEALTFAYRVGAAAPAAQSITLGSTEEPVSFTAAATTESEVPWLVVFPSSGTTPATLSVTVDPVQLVPGRQTGTITISSPGSADQTVAIVVNVSTANAVVQGLVHGATLAPTAVAPGQVIMITGSGLGPVTGVAARPSAAGAIETRLSNVRVLFDSVPAPILYVRGDQINAIVPYAMQGRSTTRIQVENGTSLSVPIEARVVEAAPGLFTTAGTGRGQVTASNSDLTANSLANPAARGSIITVYGTGEGQTEPLGQDGRIISTDLRRPLLQVTATIGGRPATVTYAGSASTQVSGIFQANILIPEDIEPGSVPIQLQVGGVATQPGITIVVR